MKKLPAWIAAGVTTLCLGMVMLAIGINAFLASQPSSSMAVTGDVQAETAQVQQLQARIAEYQQREKQYQSQVDQLGQRLEQANNELTQYQGLMNNLQEMGVIRVNREGEISVLRARLDDHSEERDDN